jgi:hypothetical protein
MYDKLCKTMTQNMLLINAEHIQTLNSHYYEIINTQLQNCNVVFEGIYKQMKELKEIHKR